MKNEILRPLGAFEQIFGLIAQTFPIHVVMAAEIEGTTSEDGWRCALDLVQDRHPLLSSWISADDAGVPYFSRQASARIPLEFLRNADLAKWPDAVAAQMALPFDASTAPMARAYVMHAAYGAVLILAVHHAISDGVSLSLLVRDVMRALTGEPIQKLPVPGSLDERVGLPPRTSITPGGRPAAHRWAGPQRGGITAAPHVEKLRLSAATTEALTCRSRGEGTTVHGAVAAALTIAARNAGPEWRQKSIRLLSPMSLRSVVDVKEDCVLCITSRTKVMTPEQDQDFWRLARHVTEDLVDGRTLQSATSQVMGMRRLVDAGIDAEGASMLVHGDRARDIMLTNLGRIGFDCQFGQLRLKSIWGPLALSGYPGEHTVGVATTNGELCLLLASRRPLMGLLAAAFDQLQLACDSTNPPLCAAG